MTTKDPRGGDDVAVATPVSPTGLESAADKLAALPPLERPAPPQPPKSKAPKKDGGGKKPPKARRRRGAREPGRIGTALARLGEQVVANVDLILIFMVLAGAQAAVPIGHPFAHDGLVPWMMLSLALAAPLRVRALGEGAHPALRARSSSLDVALRRIARAALPLASLGLYLMAYWVLLPSKEAGPPLARLDLGLLRLSITPGVLQALGAGVGLSALVVFARGVSTNDGRTAWNPPGPSWVRFWVPGAILFVVLSIGCGTYDGTVAAALQHRADTGVEPGLLVWAEWLGASLVLGTVFLMEGLLDGSTRHLRQRLASGQRNGEPWKPGRFKYTLAFVGPSMGLFLLMQAVRLLQGGSPGFEQAFVAAIFVLAWVAVLWPTLTPVAMHCLLIEVRPSSGKDEKGGDTALDFDQVPKGALRINPVEMRPTRAIHPWLVPVQLGRIEDLDDPVKPLWGRPNRPRDHHILGDASFELDPVSKQPQFDVITLRLRAPDDVTTISGGNAQSRRIAVLRAYPVGDARRGQQSVTYRWDTNRLPPGSMQVVDSTTRALELRDGDVLVLSSEGVARAYAVEIGAPVYKWGPLSTSRTPQVEDYAKL